MIKIQKYKDKLWKCYHYSVIDENVTKSSLCVFKECNNRKKSIFITDVRTIEKYRNKGYAKYLLKDVIRRFRGKYDFIYLGIKPSDDCPLKMEQLIDFYKKVGFTIHKNKFGKFIGIIK